MSSSYSNKKVIDYNKGDTMSEKLEVFNFNSKGNKINPKNIIIRDKTIYEIIKRYVKL